MTRAPPPRLGEAVSGHLGAQDGRL